MNKPKIGLIGGWFQHAFSSSLWKHPTYFEWSKGNIENITCFADFEIVSNINTKCNRKFAWVVESSAIIPGCINDIIKYHKEYQILMNF